MGRWARGAHGLIGAGLLAGAIAGSVCGVEWVRVWFYQIAWWGYILLLDGLIRARTGNSLIIDRRDTFWVMCLASASFWFFWEIVNVRLGNWYYVGVPRSIWLRWPGAFVAYATVLPGVLETYEVIRVYGWINCARRVRPFPPGNSWYPWFFVIGILMFILPLLYPRLFFPLVWGWMIFALEPVNHRWGLPSLMREWQQGSLNTFVRLLVAGGICGLVWESLNWLAAARWVYTIPYLATPKLFAMPLAGYLGFPPFGVECYEFFACVGLLRGGRGWQAHDHQRTHLPLPPKWVRWVVVAGALAMDVVALVLMDRYTIKGWIW